MSSYTLMHALALGFARPLPHCASLEASYTPPVWRCATPMFLGGRESWLSDHKVQSSKHAHVEEGLTHVLLKLVRQTASHTVGGHGRDWRGVFDRLVSGCPGEELEPETLREAVQQIAGPQLLGEDGALEEVVHRFDRTGSGTLSYSEFEAMINVLFQNPLNEVQLLPRLV